VFKRRDFLTAFLDYQRKWMQLAFIAAESKVCNTDLYLNTGCLRFLECHV